MSANSEVQAVALLQAEFARLCDASRGAWQSYLTWFTWFNTTQLAVVGWIVTKTADLQEKTGIVMLAAVLLAFNVLGIVAAVHQRAYSRVQAKCTASILDSLSACARRSGLAIEITSGLCR